MEENLVSYKLKNVILDYYGAIGKIVDCKTSKVVNVSVTESTIIIEDNTETDVLGCLMQYYYLVAVDRFWLETEERYEYTFWVINPN